MRYNRCVRRIAPYLVLLASLALCVPGGVLASQHDIEQSRLRILLVGNSYTRFNMLPVLLHRFAQTVTNGPPVTVESVAHGGFTLRRHWLKREAPMQIRRGHYTHVVLQDHSLRAIDRADEMKRYVERFTELISKTGAKTVLYETWARGVESPLYRKRPELGSPIDMLGRISETYDTLAEENGAGLAPVGNAFMLANMRAPSLPLYRSDGAHPTLQGSYLAACVLYRAITGIDPRQGTYTPHGLDEDEAQVLRRLAAQIWDLEAPPAAL